MGVYRLLKKDQAQLGAQEDFYWKYETFSEGANWRVYQAAMIALCHTVPAVSFSVGEYD